MHRRTRKVGHVALLSNRDSGDSGKECEVVLQFSDDSSPVALEVVNPTTRSCGGEVREIALSLSVMLAMVASKRWKRRLPLIANMQLRR